MHRAIRAARQKEKGRETQNNHRVTMELISIARRAGVPMNNNKAREHTTPHGMLTIRGRSLRATLTFGLASFMQIPPEHLFSPAVREMRFSLS